MVGEDPSSTQHHRLSKPRIRAQRLVRSPRHERRVLVSVGSNHNKWQAIGNPFGSLLRGHPLPADRLETILAQGRIQLSVRRVLRQQAAWHGRDSGLEAMMLRSLNDLRRYGISAMDGDLGWVHDFFFDDRDWVIRYLVIDTGMWLPRQRVLITWGSVAGADPAIRRLLVNLTREQVRHCPDIDTEKPVSRQMELKVSEYFALPPWWAAGGILGPPGAPVPAAEPAGPPTATATAEAPSEEPTLRSLMKVTGYRIEATDGPIGHIQDFIGDEETWTIRYLAIDTRNWLPGRKVLISPEWVRRLSWEEGKVYVDRDRDAIKNSPEYDPTAPVNREYEVRLYDYYGRPCYWQ